MPVSWQIGPESSCAMSILVAIIPSACEAWVPAISVSRATPMAARTSGGRLVEVSVTSSIKLSFRNVISSRVALLLAPEAGCVVGVAMSGIFGVLWIRAQRTAAARERRAGGYYAVRSHAFFHPIDDGGEHVEMVERCATA